MTRDIGLGITAPEKECDDKHCPFHGSLPVRGRLFDGRVTGSKSGRTITLQKEAPVYFGKFRRYARSKSSIHAHVPACISAPQGSRVLTAECRPISKSVSYVVVEVRD
ncbi:MAG: 30S ribosomal protein S17 [Nitrosopumilus sp.]|nr:30S ribosomal protein S17 [Nitrosopumilus sp.]MDA7943657.1 30S ribosomal protein S17 [Nitrosopumilus sp.]MDA7952472.1 30S ribosomal protein S17 [Nitrosopumilus sp.]MDA7957610.1 30S ribosomal protein S17 [Nitrosopumilus sp.]MDA7960565.1 30S ribosomal protein S17 [Nitrosopumilus sp.]